MKRHPNGYLVKLVRDRVRDKMGGDGTVTYGPMPRDEHVKRLRAKLIEEAAEYVVDPSVAELANVLEAARALATVDLRVSWEEVNVEAARDRRVRGGFDAGIGMYAHHPWDDEEVEAA